MRNITLSQYLILLLLRPPSPPRKRSYDATLAKIPNNVSTLQVWTCLPPDRCQRQPPDRLPGFNRGRPLGLFNNYTNGTHGAHPRPMGKFVKSWETKKSTWPWRRLITTNDRLPQRPGASGDRVHKVRARPRSSALPTPPDWTVIKASWQGRIPPLDGEIAYQQSFKLRRLPPIRPATDSMSAQSSPRPTPPKCASPPAIPTRPQHALLNTLRT